MKWYKKLLIALGFTFFVILVTWYFGQYLSCVLGIFTGVLRIKLFWVSDEGEPFVEHEIKLPKVERKIEIQEALVHDYRVYEEETKKVEFWRKPLGFLLLASAVFGLVIVDKRMIFYTFLMAMFTTWMWFQWWLEYKVKS